MKQFIFLLIFLGGLVVSPAQEAEPAAPADQKTTQPKAPVSIPVTEITIQADQVHGKLNAIREETTLNPEIQKLMEEWPAILDSLIAREKEPIFQKLDQLSPRKLQGFEQEWSVILKRLNQWNDLLLEQIQLLQEKKKWLNQNYAQWEVTAKAIEEEDIPQSIRDRIASIMTEIDTVRNHIVDRLNTLLNLQNQISEQQITIGELLNAINTTETELRTHLFIQDSPPLWEAFGATKDSLSFRSKEREAWQNFADTLDGFYRSNLQAIKIHLLLFMITLFIMVYFYWRNKQEKLFREGEDVLKASAFFISRPVSAALLVTLFFSIWLYQNVTDAISELFIIILLIPFLRLMTGVVVPERRKAVYLLSFLYFLVFVNNNAVNDVLIQRLLLLVITLITTALFAWIVYQVHPVAHQRVKPWPKFLFRILPVAILALFVALVANIIGSVVLAHLIVVGIIKSVIIGTILYVIARVIDGMVVLLIRKRTIQGLQFVDTYAHRMEHWAVFAVHLIAFFVWVRATLKAFRLYDPVYDWLQMILETRWQIGALTISVASIVNFILILTVTFVIARLIRILLDIEVFPRIRLPRGIPGAISMVVRYTVIGLGFFLALSAMGIDLGKFGLLAGALGVGLGFGLQNVIANFVSGLILVFERPIQVGDKIEVGNVLGLVKQIGVRSSTIRTFDGSEVIVPNADLISQQVTNWTLSDNRQRMKLPVKVAFDSDPEEVLELLLRIAREHPGVLNDPEPIATFNGFGDYFLDFTLYYWVSTNILQTKTEVALQVYRAIQTLGIEKPRPEQKLYLKNLEEQQSKRASGKRKSGKGTGSSSQKESEP